MAFMGRLTSKMAKVFLFGIDGAEPDLIFNQWREDLPNINRLMSSGSFARMKSTIPPTTIIAWNAMISGKDASELGVFSYTYKDSEGKTQLVSSKNIQSKLLWDILGEHNKRTIALYVPLSYPVKPIHGLMVSDFLTPSIDAECTFPLSLKEKIKKLGSTDIFFDVAVGLAGHKGLHLDHLAQKTKEMTEMQIRLVKDLAENESWDFFMTVMIGSDRLQHMAWRHFDPTHRRFIPDSPHKNTLKEYYIYLDGKLGEILSLLDKETTIIVASDHGMVKQEGKININYWLMEKRYLFLTEDFKQEIEVPEGIEIILDGKMLKLKRGSDSVEKKIDVENLTNTFISDANMFKEQIAKYIVSITRMPEELVLGQVNDLFRNLLLKLKEDKDNKPTYLTTPGFGGQR